MRLVLSALISLGLLAACAPKLTEGEVKVKRLKTSVLLDNLDSLAHVDYDFVYVKMSTKYKDTLTNISFKTSVRMECDSALSALITYAAIPVANTLVTRDSLVIVNKREKCYSRSDLNYLQENFGLTLEFRNLQELLLGQPLDYDTTQKYFQIHEPTRYVISSHRKRFIRRLDKKEEEEKPLVIKYFLAPNAKQLTGMEIISPGDSASVFIAYLERQEIEGRQLPLEVSIEVFTPKNHIFIELSYQKMELNDPTPLYFTIPESYEECE